MYTENDLKRAQAEAWELAKKIAASTGNGGYSMAEMDDIFGNRSIDAVFLNNTFEEAIQKVRAWEEEKKTMHVGDVVINKFNRRAVVTCVWGESFYVLFKDGSCGDPKKFSSYDLEWKKTGERIDLADIFTAIRGKEE